MIAVRSVVFNLVFYAVLFLYLLAALPTLLLPRKALLWMVRNWSALNLKLLRAICNLDVEFRGLERVPPGAILLAAKHQSMWETFALITVLRDPAFVLKRELLWIPFFGWCASKARMIPVDRGARSQALAGMTAHARVAVAERREIVIFPEGTRRAPGAEPRYKFGVAFLYEALGIPCVPVALNSGLFWPRRSFLRYPGVVRVEFLQPLPPGLDRQAFFDRLQEDVEAATARLVAAERSGRSDGAAPSFETPAARAPLDEAD